MFRWLQFLILVGFTIAAAADTVPHMAAAFAQYGGDGVSPPMFLAHFFSDLYTSAATGAQVTDFFGTWSACLVFTLAEALRMRSAVAWILLALSPIGLFTAVFPAMEALRVWRKEDGKPAPGTAPEYLQFRIALYAVIAIVAGIVTAAYMFAHFGPNAWFVAFNAGDPSVQRYMADLARSPAAATLGDHMQLVTFAFFLVLIRDAVRRRALMPVLLLLATIPLGLTVTLPLYFLWCDFKGLWRQPLAAANDPETLKFVLQAFRGSRFAALRTVACSSGAVISAWQPPRRSCR